MSKLTIIDVARLAGVSTATVSRAMHAPHLLRPATLARVQAAMEDSGYIYNATAGDFSRRKSTVLGLLVLSNTTKVAESIKAMQQMASEHGFPLILCTSGFDTEIERKHIQLLQERNVAGILVAGHTKENRPLLEALHARNIPCLFLWDTFPGTSLHYIGTDNEAACYMMTSYLIELGHKRIGFICGIYAGVERIYKRYAGYKRALEDHGLPVEQELVRPLVSSYENGKKGMEALLQLPNPPRCVFCASDVLAMGALSAAYNAKIAVPDELTLVGFDNSLQSAYTCPPLTTVEVSGSMIGKMAMEALLKLIRSPVSHPPVQITLPAQLVLRGSHAIPREANGK